MGDYVVILENEFGCVSESEPFACTNVGIAEICKSFKLFPNPSHGGSLYLEGFTEQVQMLIHDAAGRVVFNQGLSAGYRKEFNPGYLQPGVYIVNIITSDKSISTRLVITKK